MKDIILCLCAAPFFIGFILMLVVGVMSCFTKNFREAELL